MSNLFPGALNTATSLPNTRATNDPIPASDHNDLASAQVAVETKLGKGASTPTTTGNVLTVTSSGTTAWAAPAAALTAFVNVKQYGAVGDGQNDDTTAIQNAINAALATSRNTAAVYLPAGTYKITSTLNCSNATSTASGKGVFLVGDGREASQIFKNGSFIAVEWKGYQGPTYPCQFGGMRNITINGNGQTGAAAHIVAGQQMEFFASSIIGNSDVALDIDTTQDSYFYDLTFNNCGSTAKPVINIYGSAYGTANMLWFNQIRVETFLNGAVWIKRGAGATGGGNNGFFFNQCKFENYPTVNGDIFFADSYTQQLCMNQIFISFGQYNTGYSTPANGIVFGDGSSTISGANQASFRDIFMNTGPTSNIGNAVIKLNGGNGMDGPIVIDNVFCTASLATSLIAVYGMTGADVSIRNLNGAPSKMGGDGTAHSNFTGTGTLSAGSCTISTSRMQAGSRFNVTRTSGGTNAGILYVSSTSNGSAVVSSTNAADTGTFVWELMD